MCGIVGVIEKDVNNVRLVKAIASIDHRGPDDYGIFVDGNIGLGHRRLSIIDLSYAASQPMSNEDKTLHIVYNGEIYNFKELKEDLLKDYTFKSNSDTEVILYLYEKYGEMCVEMLNGMFAFAIWDSKKQKLFIARDRAGIKPLYLYADNKSIMFASEIKALFKLGAKKELNKEILLDYFNYQISISNETLFKNIYSLPQGYYAIVSKGIISMRRYWQPVYKQEEKSSEELIISLIASVKRQMISDVPVGTFLSGGLDSSLITAIASRVYSQQQLKHRMEGSRPTRDKGDGSPRDDDKTAADTSLMKTFTAGFEGYEDEINYAKEVSQSLGTEHHSVIISPRMFVDSLPKLIHHYDQPISFASSVGLHFVSKLAAEHGVKVILTGEGADELLAGYSRYERLQNILNISNGDGMFPYLKGLPFKITSKFFHDPRYLKNIELIMNGNNYDYLTGINSIIGRERDKYLLKSSNKDKNHPLRGTVNRLYNGKDIEILNKLLYLDWYTYLQELLTKQDRMSMSASIESRVPFLDNEVINFANSLPIDSKLNDKVGKDILRKAAEDILPKEVINRKKIGFTVPLDEWFRGPLYEYLKEQLLNDNIVHKFFGKVYIEDLLNKQKKHNCSLQLWTILNFKIWYQQHFDQPIGEMVSREPHENNGQGLGTWKPY